ncbi:MAG: thioredoxin domain-containing protein [Deltaproteobacteria bacterium]|nr:thioredoxin domain-containing protein [Deltaproteobacteria bacterium]
MRDPGSAQIRAAEDARSGSGENAGSHVEPTGRLACQRSVYLRQHALNPVDWYPWGEEALERARAEDRPIFLSIGYSACHWCHEMARQVFEDRRIAELLDAHFISIKVDREERPDIDRAYMDAVVAMTGQGGWPLTVFLTPDLEPFFGGTFFPPEPFLSILSRIASEWLGRRETIAARAKKVRAYLGDQLEALSPVRSEPGQLGEALLDAAVVQAAERFDERWGGLRGRMKFPTPVLWRFLLHRHRAVGDPDAERMVRRTLDSMASGGIRDHLAGGFHRYAVEPSWRVPHFEKMLYDNAQLAGLYTEAAVVLVEASASRVARETLDYMLAEMRDPDSGLFYSSVDADSEGEEGRFYLWRPQELTVAVGPEDGPVLSALLGVEAEDSLGGRSPLTRRVEPESLSARFERPAFELQGLFDARRAALLAHRLRRSRPAVDRKVVTAYNGLALSAYSQAASAFDDVHYLAAAEQLAASLHALHRRDDGSLFRVSNLGRAEHEAVLDDYAFFTAGLLDLHQASGRLVYLQRALELLDYAEAHFGRPGCAFFLTHRRAEAPLGRQIEIEDGARPSGNAAMLQSMLRAGSLAGDDARFARARTCLEAHAALLGSAGISMAGWLDAALIASRPVYVVVVVGDPSDLRTRSLLRTFRERAPVHALLATIGAEGASPDAVATIPVLAGKRAIDGRPTAFVCQRGICQRPVHTAEELLESILTGWKK